LKPSGQVKIDFLPSKPFQSGQNQLPQFQAIPINIVNKVLIKFFSDRWQFAKKFENLSLIWIL
jgi:hypothetical protein